MNVLLVLSSECLADALKRYLSYHYSYTTSIILTDNFPTASSSMLFSFDLYIIEAYGGKHYQSCPIGLHLGTILDNYKKNTVYFYSHHGLKKEYQKNMRLNNCFSLPEEIESFLSFLKHPEKPQKSASELLQLFYSTPLTSDHY